MMGRQVSLQHNRRCDWENCSKGPVKFGYRVNDPHFKGFFCSARHAQAAHEHMEEVKKKTGIESEGLAVLE